MNTELRSSADSRIGNDRLFYTGEILPNNQRNAPSNQMQSFVSPVPMQRPINKLANALVREISTTDTTAQTLPSDRDFLDGATKGVKDTGSDILAAGKLAWRLTSSSQEREQFTSAIGKIAEVLQDPARREQALELIGSELGKGMVDAFQHFFEEPDYYSGYLMGSIAAGGAIGKLAKVAATATKLDEIAAKVWGTVQRLEVKVEGLGSNGGNIKASLRPRAPSFIIGQSDGDPGVWSREVTPAKGSDYQHTVTGAPKDVEYVVETPHLTSGKKKFDGYDPVRNVLIDAKDWGNGDGGWPPKNRQGVHHDWSVQEIVKDAENQANIGKDIGIKVEWHFPTQEKANEIKLLLSRAEITGITTKVTPK